MKKIISTLKEIIFYCSKHDFKDLLKLFAELLIIALIITVFKLPFIMVRDFGIEIFTSIGWQFNNIVLFIWNLIFDLSYLVVGIMVFINIVNKRYSNINDEEKKDL